MANRPDPATFAKYSYYLAYVSAGILLLGFLLSFVRLPIASVLIQIVWLALVTGYVGMFMGYAASRDFKKKPGPDEAMNQARIGFRVNMGAAAATTVLAIFSIIIRILASSPVNVK